MRITVDYDLCESHGLCVFTAPEVFRMDDGGDLHHDATPGPQHHAAVRDAAAGCPTGAIRIQAD